MEDDKTGSTWDGWKVGQEKVNAGSYSEWSMFDNKCDIYEECTNCHCNSESEGCSRHKLAKFVDKSGACPYLTEKERLFNDTFK